MVIGRSQVMRNLRTQVERIARTDFTVLVEGESGAGKELVAQQVHQHSRRSKGPFVAVNCAALVETLVEAELFGIEERTATGVKGRRGKFELADRGTLFLDEVGDLSPTAQAKLLRVLQDMWVERVGGAAPYQVDTRIVAATNRRLQVLVEQGQFRADLYYRLAGVELTVPPLRDRRQDIPLLVAHFLEHCRDARRHRLAPAALEALVTFDWPGNVRQLQRVLERAIALAAATVITLDDLPASVTGEYRECLGTQNGRGESLRAWSSRYVQLVLQRCQGNKRKACDLLEITYHTLQSHLTYGQTATAGTSQSTDATPRARTATSAPIRTEHADRAQSEVADGRNAVSQGSWHPGRSVFYEVVEGRDNRGRRVDARESGPGRRRPAASGSSRSSRR